MSVSIRQVHPVFVGEVSGVDLARPLSREEDLVIWDNRQVMHRVRRYDESQPRDMRRTTVAGDVPTVAQASAA